MAKKGLLNRISTKQKYALIITVAIILAVTVFQDETKVGLVVFFQLGNVIPLGLVYDAGFSSADFDGSQIISCLHDDGSGRACPEGLSYEPEQVRCPDGSTVSEFVFPEACPTPTTRTCNDGSVIPYANSCPVPIIDTDGDGISDPEDGCPLEPETLNGYFDTDGCPDIDPNTDTDDDGIIDLNDACPLEPETINQFEDNDGCPDEKPKTDGDNDGIFDEFDECPLQGGIVQQNGCPFPDTDTDDVIDTDGDGIADDIDLCPDTLFGIVVNSDGCHDSDDSPIDIIDTDNDGIIDELDQCPMIGGDINPEDGCPFPDDETGEDIVDMPPDECGYICQLIEIDTDDDGVKDVNDQCPLSKGTPENDGCPDSDDPVPVFCTSPFVNINGICVFEEPIINPPTIFVPQEPSTFIPDGFPTTLVIIVIVGIVVFAVILKLFPSAFRYFNLSN